jgi:HEAT repeat protein
MTNSRAIRAIEERHRARAVHAQRVYQSYAEDVPELIQQLNNSSSADHRRAYKLLKQMDFLIVPDLVAALTDPRMKETALEEIIAILGDAGNRLSIEPLWEYFQRVQRDPLRASCAALSLAQLGDTRVLAYARQYLENNSPLVVSRGVRCLYYLGELEDVGRLRSIYRCSQDYEEQSSQIRNGTVKAILAILEDVDKQSAEQIREQIRESYSDQALWRDISAM